ncbi:hypothetical protein HPB51_005471 [Rhipicephalus microplus]|uniref:Uncharacterized protein n=1 Tax=Rhipicephalus microplus TaxID=6941 RepID=A0A9J6EY91_RHIMP|nr:hypothetical protein HPB51_005471 [Rhipicephalus microplus]
MRPLHRKRFTGKHVGESATQRHHAPNDRFPHASSYGHPDGRSVAPVRTACRIRVRHRRKHVFQTVLQRLGSDITKRRSPGIKPLTRLHRGIKDDALKVVNEYLSSNVSLQEVNDFAADVEKGKIEVAELYVNSMMDLTPDVTAAEWGEILRKFHVTNLENATAFPASDKNNVCGHLKAGQKVTRLGVGFG